MTPKENMKQKMKECVAPVGSVLDLRLYLSGIQFTVRTVGDSLILRLVEITGKLSRWRLRVFEYDVGVVHRAAIERWVADALSRLQPMSEDRAQL